MTSFLVLVSYRFMHISVGNPEKDNFQNSFLGLTNIVLVVHSNQIFRLIE
jgi:hypothetical protein